MIRMFKVGNEENAQLRFAFILDPLSGDAQRYSALLEVRGSLDTTSLLSRCMIVGGPSAECVCGGVSLAATVYRGAR